jgi:hypothetical protein
MISTAAKAKAFAAVLLFGRPRHVEAGAAVAGRGQKPQGRILDPAATVLPSEP